MRTNSRSIPKKEKEEIHSVNGVSMKATCSRIPRRTSLCNMIYSRSLGKPCEFRRHVETFLRTRVVTESPLFLRCRNFELNSVDKVFTSRWLNSNVIVAGTKCNRLLLFQLETSAIHDISLIPSICERPEGIGPLGGIHGMDVNPRGTFLATSGANETEVNIFDVDSLTPRVAFINGHRDWIFDIRWLNDRRLVSCSREGKLALWSLDNYLERQGSFDQFGKSLTDRYLYDTPIVEHYFEDREYGGLPLRAMTYAEPINRLSIITTRKQIKVLDTGDNLSEVRSIAMQSCCHDTVTAAYNPTSPHEIAVGSQTHVNLYDIRVPLGLVRNFRSKHYSYGVRSVQFNSHMLSYSTGRGSIFFYDIRGGYHLDFNRKVFSVNLGKLPDVEDRQSVPNSSLSFPCVAVYTHEYDHSRTRIFCAGGPLAACESGSYASLWW